MPRKPSKTSSATSQTSAAPVATRPGEGFAALLSRLSRADRLFCMLDALGMGEGIENRPLGNMLLAVGALPPGLPGRRLGTDIDTYREAVAKKLKDVYDGPYCSDMKANARFELITMALEDSELDRAITKECANTQGLETDHGRALAQIVALFKNREAEFLSLVNGDPSQLYASTRRDVLVRTAFTMDWFHSRTPKLQGCVLTDLLGAFEDGGFIHPLLGEIFEEYVAGRVKAPWLDTYTVAQMHFWHGDWKKADSLLPPSVKPRTVEDPGLALAHQTLALFRRDASALTWTARAMTLLKRMWRGHGKIGVFLFRGLCIDLSRFLFGGAKEHDAMIDNINRVGNFTPSRVDRRDFGSNGFISLLALHLLRNGDRAKGKRLFAQADLPLKNDDNFLSVLLTSLASIRLSDKPVPLDFLRRWHEKVAAFPCLRILFAELIQEHPRATEADRETCARGSEFPELLDFTSIVQDMPDWLVRVTALENLAKRESETTKSKRLLWVVDLPSGTVDAYEQTLGQRGWGKPRRCALRRIYETPPDHMNDVDRLIASHMQVDKSWWQVEYSLDLDDCCEALSRSDRVYEEARGGFQPLTFREGKAEFTLKEAGRDSYCMSFVARQPDQDQRGSGQPIVLRPRSVQYVRKDNQVFYYRLSPMEVEIAKLLDKGLVFPKKELGRVLTMTRTSLNADLRTEDVDAETVDTDSTPVLQLEQTASGFEALAGVRPFGRPSTPFFQTGTGTETPLATVDIVPDEGDGKDGDGQERSGTAATPVKKDGETPRVTRTLRVERDFKAEEKALSMLLSACPTLASNFDNGHWTSGNLEETLSLLEELRESGLPYRLEWPRGSRLKIRGSVDPSKIKARISWNSHDWFGLSGTVALDGGENLDLSLMLANLKGSRFVSLGDGEYVALTADLRRKLSSLKLVGSEDRKGAFQVNALASAAVEQSLEDIELEVDPKWTANVERMREAFATTPPVPSLLQADLREYQREGYEWMQRLAIWGVGACLADDMGLGKTVQSIAVILNQAQKGPCLVVAPTSVCANWEQELERFAPSLNVRRFAMQGRAATVRKLTAGDVLVVGYGLLPNVEKELSGKNWSMVVFDEAQALKNADTKRAKTAAKLKADFRLALTGTPIENRIDDLWSLFNVINPGLLGTWDNFLHRYGTASQPGTPASRALRAVVRPFLLRRLKSNVLDELPEKTEQTILVEPTPQEAAFYESLRQSAVSKLHSSDLSGGQKRFAILAELTRLRRACCHPGLADPDMMAMEKYSSKTTRFLEMVSDLVSSGHKVLAFSQFTTYLAQIREALTENGIPYQYLDGQTPEKVRRERVAAFQRGEGDVFLLSLKAGGTGLNLTAADYVVHLDPWWNPAVEDQASDRAHRIGQKRPVTIYRMVQTGTVEEKILDLHASKRELAAEFLEGTETSVKSMTEAELLQLLQ